MHNLSVKDVQSLYCVSPLHTAVTADVVLPPHCVDHAVQRAHGHFATIVDHACCSPPLIVLRTELLYQTGWVLLGPSPHCQHKTHYLNTISMSKHTFFLLSILIGTEENVSFTVLPVFSMIFHLFSSSLHAVKAVNK